MTTTNETNHSNKRILARGCDYKASQWAVKNLPPLLGNPEYVATTNDGDFIEKVKKQKWSVIYFAPGACRFSAAQRIIPGSNEATKGWGLPEYKKLIHQYQGANIRIVESLEESKSLELLKKALANANIKE